MSSSRITWGMLIKSNFGKALTKISISYYKMFATPSKEERFAVMLQQVSGGFESGLANSALLLGIQRRLHARTRRCSWQYTAVPPEAQRFDPPTQSSWTLYMPSAPSGVVRHRQWKPASTWPLPKEQSAVWRAAPGRSSSYRYLLPTSGGGAHAFGAPNQTLALSQLVSGLHLFLLSKLPQFFL
mmetsp:Transcript_38886/g.49105  ORF Transcript_38886/g.49105 Transcript_38886/m.49105 type:complete len:184 (+) Transcript_38886:159-710(+)